MAKIIQTIPQSYPRIEDANSPEHGLLDESKLLPHQAKIPVETIKQLILEAIENASKKSSREIVSIPAEVTDSQLTEIHRKAGRELLAYFKRYCGDPAATTHQIYRKHYRDVGIEQFRNRTLQKERMNSGWRYQFLSRDCAIQSKRFKSVSDLGAAEADFYVLIEYLDKTKTPLVLYVSVKNRTNTMGGGDWPKAIEALETVAKNDKNRTGAYCCVFGMVMDKGLRHIKISKKTKHAYSPNTEVWMSDFFWPFFANYSYQEIMTFVLDILLESQQVPLDMVSKLPVPDDVLEGFGEACAKAKLIDENGYFNDPHALVNFFCNDTVRVSQKKKDKK